MELETQLADFADRIQSACGPYIIFDEVQQWPKGRLDELLGIGVVIKTTPATKIKCTECSSMDCPPIEPSIETLPGATEPVGLFMCTKEGGGGFIKIPLERFQRWEIVIEKLKELGHWKKPASTSNDTDTTDPNDNWITVGTAAKELNIHAGTVGRWTDDGKLTDNGKKRLERRISWSSILILKDQKDRKICEGDVDDLKRDAANLPEEH